MRSYLFLKEVTTRPSSNPDNQPSVACLIKKNEKYTKDDPRQTQLTDSILLFIAGDVLPLKTVDSPHFRSLCNKFDPRYTVPDRKHLSSKLLVEKAASVQNQLKNQLSRAQMFV